MFIFFAKYFQYNGRKLREYQKKTECEAMACTAIEVTIIGESNLSSMVMFKSTSRAFIASDNDIKQREKQTWIENINTTIFCESFEKGMLAKRREKAINKLAGDVRSVIRHISKYKRMFIFFSLNIQFIRLLRL